MVRMGLGRNRYRMSPGLYRTGTPGGASPVFVTANYKLTVDHLRRALKGMDAWILVLDTKGINVWCAAGKGTFGTGELIRRIEAVGLSGYVEHRRLILPQLGAPGMIPREVKEQTGFSIIYGPVEARDLPAFMEKGMKADAAMRRKQFPLSERLAVSLTHFVQGLAPSLGIAAFFVLLDLLFFRNGSFSPAASAVRNASAALASIFTGSLLAGALLPVLPGRAFSLKGVSIGLLYSIAVRPLLAGAVTPAAGLDTAGKLLLLLCWIVFQVLNLTGSSTYTSLSGVRKEMGITIPFLAAGVLGGLALLITGGILS